MAVVELKRDPTRREVRQFAGVWLPAAVALIGGMIWYATGSLRIPVMVWLVGFCGSIAGLLVPAVGWMLFIAWMYATFPLGWTISHVMLAVIYYGVMTPIGLLVRLVRRDPLRLRFDRSADTYWIERHAVQDMETYFRRF